MTRPIRSQSVAGGITEAAFQKQVEALAQFYGWRHYHPPDNRPIDGRGRRQRATPGYPDLTLVRNDAGVELIWAELKRDTTYPSPAQREWIDDLRSIAEHVAAAVRAARDADVVVPVVIDVYVWRPRDFDAIQTRLARGRAVIPASFDPRLV